MDNTFETACLKRHNKKITLFFVKLFTFLLAFSMFILYFLTPVSNVKKANIIGLRHMSNDDVLQILNINYSDKLYSLREDKLLQNLYNYDLIENPSISIRPFSLDIKFDEVTPLCKVNDKVYLTNGKEANNSFLDEIYNKLISGYDDDLPVFSTQESTSNFQDIFSPIFNLSDELKKKIDYIYYEHGKYQILFIDSIISSLYYQVNYSKDEVKDLTIKQLKDVDRKYNLMDKAEKEKLITKNNTFNLDVIVEEN